ncbi:MAG: hypothetical protein O7A04_08380 [Acidobacteria bacterium]|nr:hypothetical protein [Acidobacteriota bacterium]
MQEIRTCCALGLLIVSTAGLSAAAEDPAWSRARRAAGTIVVQPHSGSIPYDGERFGPAAVPLERGHYMYGAEWMANARRESYVDPEVQEGWSLRRDVGVAGEPMTSRAPGRRLTFDGLNRATSAYEGRTGFPADATLSVSPTRILQATNIALRMTGRDGIELDRTPLNSFFGFDSNFVLFDPKVYFDRLSERFFLVALEHDDVNERSAIWLAVSKGDSPSALSAPDQFCTYRIRAKRAGSSADYPVIGINENWFAVGVNNFRFSNGFFRRAHVYVMPVAQITDNASSCPALGVKRFDPQRDAAGITAFTIHPAQHYSTNGLPGEPLFLVSSSAFVPATDYTLWRITTDAGGQPRLAKHVVSGDFAYFIPPGAPQKGGSVLDAGDTRITQAAFRDGKVWAAHATACGIGPLPNESCVRAVQFSLPATGPPSIAYSETFGRQNTFLFWPGIAINKDGDVAMAFHKSKSGTYLGTVFNGKRASANHFDVLRNLRIGTCPLDNFDPGLMANRTGDYVGLQTDPADNLSFWLAGEYPGNIAGVGCDWKTRIGKAKY